jgi:uncharacterized membrane protein
MADYTVTPAPRTENRPPETATLIAYLLLGGAAVLQVLGSGFAVPAPLLTFVGIAGVIVAYANRAEARGTWVESHLTWLIRTFWWSTIWAVVGWLVLLVLAIVLIGFALGPLIWFFTAIWVLYRVIRGFIAFNGSRPIPGV